ncbi:MAG: phosphodiesterase [Woeseiaceae bacterium]|nr:phosphodiesterase [Woeseiaceae bacterium]
MAVRVLQITDPHLFANAAGSLRGAVTDESLRRVLRHVRASGWPADLVAMTGDIIQDDTAEAYERFRGHFEPLGLPVHCVPGNHDVRALMRAALADPPFYYCGTHEQDGWLIAGIDSCMEGSAGGRVAADEADRLMALLASTAARHVLVCLHHPPLPLGSRWLDRVGLDDSDAFLRRIAADGKVRGCLFGHVHQAFEGAYGDMRIIGTPSTCRQFLPGSDDFAVDDRPPAYRRVALGADGAITTELVWVPAETGEQP